MCGVTAGNDVRSESAAEQPWAVAGGRVPGCRWGPTGSYHGGQQPLLWHPPACAGPGRSTADSGSEAETAEPRGGSKICCFLLSIVALMNAVTHEITASPRKRGKSRACCSRRLVVWQSLLWHSVGNRGNKGDTPNLVLTASVRSAHPTTQHAAPSIAICLWSWVAGRALVRVKR